MIDHGSGAATRCCGTPRASPGRCASAGSEKQLRQKLRRRGLPNHPPLFCYPDCACALTDGYGDVYARRCLGVVRDDGNTCASLCPRPRRMAPMAPALASHRGAAGAPNSPRLRVDREEKLAAWQAGAVAPQTPPSRYRPVPLDACDGVASAGAVAGLSHQRPIASGAAK